MKNRKRSVKQREADTRDLGIVCAVLGFVLLFVAVMTPILYLLEQNKRLEAQTRR